MAGLYLVLWGKSQERAIAAAKEASAAAAIADHQQQPASAAAADSCLKQPLLPASTVASENV